MTQAAYGSSTKHISGREEDSKKKKKSMVINIVIDRWCLVQHDFGLMNELSEETVVGLPSVGSLFCYQNFHKGYFFTKLFVVFRSWKIAHILI